MKVFPAFSLLVMLLSLLAACDAGSDATFSGDSEELAVTASVGYYGAATCKDTSIATTDTIYLSGSYTPVNGANLSGYFWRTGLSTVYSEYQVKITYGAAGEYTPVFYVIDAHGDTLSDSVHVLVSSAPALDTLSWLPQDGSEKLPADTLNFAWSVTDSDGDAVASSFSLSCGSGLAFDTVLSAAFLQLRDLPELESCSFSVSVSDEHGILGNSISSSFTTRASDSSARFSGTLSASPDSLLNKVSFVLIHEGDTAAMEFEGGTFDSTYAPPGTYTLLATLDEYPDYEAVSKTFTLRAGEYLSGISLKLRDSGVPGFPEDLGDTLPMASELRLALTNGGVPLDSASQVVTLDGNSLSVSFLGDTLVIPLPTYRLPICRLMDLKIVDYAGNSTARSLYLCPATIWAEINPDTTISRSDSLEVFYRDLNTYGLTIKQVEWEFETYYGWAATMLFDEGTSEGYFHLAGRMFPAGTYEIPVTALYTNGLALKSSFTLEVTE